MVTSPTIIWRISGGYSLNMASLYYFPHITWAHFFKKKRVGFTTHLPHKFHKKKHTNTLSGGPTCFCFLECLTELRLGSQSFFLKKKLCGWGPGVWGRAHWGLRNSLSQELRWKKGPPNKGRRRGRKRRRQGSSLGGEKERERERKGRPKLPAQSQVAATCLILNSVDACVRWEIQMLSVFSACKTVLRRASCGP